MMQWGNEEREWMLFDLMLIIQQFELVIWTQDNLRGGYLKLGRGGVVPAENVWVSKKHSRYVGHPDYHLRSWKASALWRTPLASKALVIRAGRSNPILEKSPGLLRSRLSFEVPFVRARGVPSAQLTKIAPLKASDFWFWVLFEPQGHSAAMETHFRTFLKQSRLKKTSLNWYEFMLVHHRLAVNGLSGWPRNSWMSKDILLCL